MVLFFMNNAETLVIGITTFQEYKNRLNIIVRGNKPKHNDPKVWFDSLSTVLEILSSYNLELLNVIIEENPDSVNKLSNITGRKSSEVSETLKRLARYGIVEFVNNSQKLTPIVKFTKFQIAY